MRTARAVLPRQEPDAGVECCTGASRRPKGYVRGGAPAGEPRHRSLSGSALDQIFEARQHLIPLLGDTPEVVLELVERRRVELEAALAPGAHTVHDAGALQRSEERRVGKGVR